MTDAHQSNYLTGHKKQQHSSMLGAALTRRIDALFRAMSADFLLREQFVTDPSQVLSEYVHGAKLPEEVASIRNQLLYAMMSNHRLLGWLQDYAKRQEGSIPTTDRFVEDFAHAVVEHDGHHIVFALIRASAAKDGSLGIEEALLPVIFAFFNRGGVLASGTEMSTGTDFGTERSGTEKSGSVFASGTEMSTGTDFGTERSGTEKSGIFASGTEMSTGTDFGTERSGTEKSGVFLAPSYVLVTLEALAQYSGQLREAGALNAFRNE